MNLSIFNFHKSSNFRFRLLNLYECINYPIIKRVIYKETFCRIEENSNELTSNYASDETINFSKVIERNRKILKKYQSLIRSAVTLDALMDSENEENYKLNK